MIRFNADMRYQVTSYINDQKRWHDKVSLRKVIDYARRLIQLEKTKPERMKQAAIVNKRLRQKQNQGDISQVNANLVALENRNERCIDRYGCSGR